MIIERKSRIDEVSSCNPEEMKHCRVVPVACLSEILIMENPRAQEISFGTETPPADW